MFVFLYVLSITGTVYSFFLRMVITSDIPPLFTTNEVCDVIWISIIVFILILITINNANSYLKKATILLPILLILSAHIYNLVNGLTVYRYYNKAMMLMDVTYLIEFLICSFYCLYRIKNKLE